MLLTKITALQNEVALSFHRLRGLYSLVVFARAVLSSSFCDDDSEG